MDNPTLTYQVKNGRILNKIDGHEAMIQAVDKILKTERFVYPIYGNQYGNDFFELFGKSFDYATVEVERMVKEALLADDRVLTVTVDDVQVIDRTILKVHGLCTTIYGDIPIESEVSVNDA
ncbi:hypothetical protein LNA01_16570 [Companilactobacillus nantensis]|uniref:DUF2634 domain-containing protein n=2 Tax=Companilactobacillus nantensis TaxID=305793 RepID=A0A0R1WNT3_9LACO|nr:DUF2634 domain-containing protein [Companilactobacillus nantensis]KRM17499.1 hypothetical protein FD31_GL002692 [Companilactobacillus nantensis DSM 16982]GEO64474.1 hypothetical protein LNA01_16570 [Companilactobacillus nantensis]